MTKDNLGRKYRILLVEDSEPDIYLFRRTLQQAGIDFDLFLVRSGDEASEFLKNSSVDGVSFDLSVLDLNLPAESGLVILEAMRRNPQMKHIPIAVMTSSESPIEREEADILGADRFILKPHSLKEFEQVGEILKDLLRR